MRYSVKNIKFRQNNEFIRIKKEVSLLKEFLQEAAPAHTGASLNQRTEKQKRKGLAGNCSKIILLQKTNSSQTFSSTRTISQPPNQLKTR